VAVEARPPLDQALLDTMMEVARDAVILIDGSGEVLRWNPAAERLFGYSEAEALGKNVHQLLAPDEFKDRAATGMRNFGATGTGETIDRLVEVDALSREGRRLRVELALTSVYLNQEWFALAVIRDATERRRIEDELRRSEHNFHNVVEMNRSGILVVDEEGCIRFANSAAQQLLGRGQEELLGMPFGVPSATLRQEMAVLRKDGTPGTAEMSATQTRWEGGAAHLVMLHDITELKEAESQARFLAMHDALTGLPNRRLFMQRLDNALRQAETEAGRVALLFMDLDRFKPINDSLGHEAGDQVLRNLARRLEQSLRSMDTIARLGGDEFAAIAPSLGSVDDVEAVLRKVTGALKPPLQVAGQELYVGVSIGVALFPDDGQDGDTLLRRADDAMYAAKRNGGSHVRYFSPAMEAGDRSQLELERRLHNALGAREFHLVYQPQVRVSDRGLSGSEVLLRWHNPEIGSVPPDRFIPMLEANGGIGAVGAWVLEQACEQIADWRSLGLHPPEVAVNVSARQLADDGFPTIVANCLDRFDLPPELLNLELTETALVQDEETTTRVLNRLADLGIALHMDDFGTGYSSLGLLRRLPFHIVKIDRSYVARMAEREDDAMLVAGIISMAHSLRKRVLAEGVETEAQFELLQEFGCDYAQGWLFGRPMEPAALRALFAGSGPNRPENANAELTSDTESG
jgi:diguanylate cyclase (GGDEF)-like protein/PAS domain S-box-containing protein